MAETPSKECALTARWVFPVAGPPVERGVVTVLGEQVVAVEPHGTRAADLDLGNAAILPGLVNAHTHLDLSGMRGRCPPSPDFTGWLRQVIAHRGATPSGQAQADVRAGIAECLRFGTTLLGDVAFEGGSWDALAEAPLRAVVFRELLGLTREGARDALRAALEWTPSRPESATCRPGLSPHAPYSFRAEVLDVVCAIGRRITIHLAESLAELELLERQSGSFVSFLTERGVWDPSGLASSPTQVIELTRLARSVLYAHGNYLGPDAPVPAHGTVVYCPRTHAAFGHAPHPFRDFLARGVRVALGTDGLASNPDLDILAEARFIHAGHPDVAGDTLLRMATLSGAEALGWADTTGSLAPGKSADLVVLPLPDTDAADPHRLVFESDRAVSAVMFRGRWRQRDTASGGPLEVTPRES
ncbi:MAG TPA: amidohydrolase family protein [Gemmataceae bacterium]|nr:amidohydrolase family protein [Gemmataceae bacterium]